MSQNKVRSFDKTVATSVDTETDAIHAKSVQTFRSRKRDSSFHEFLKSIKINRRLILASLTVIITALCLWINVSAEIGDIPLIGLCVAAIVLATFTMANSSQDPSLKKRNSKLAERLEVLDDQTWEIRESEEIHRSLTEAFGDIVLHRDSKGKVSFSNGNFSKYFDTNSSLPKIDNNSDNAKSRDIEIETLQGQKWFSWIDLEIRDPISGKRGVRSVARDITNRKSNEVGLMGAVEAAQEANAEKTRFLAMVSHEIRTPLNGVLGMAKLLLDSNLSPSQRSHTEAIETSGTTLLSLVNDLLDSARIEAGQMDIQTRPTDVVKLIEEVADIVCPAARSKQVDFATHISPSVPEKLVVDPDRLRQILLNLAGNAAKFTSTGGISVRAHLKSGVLHIAVQDTGPGLSKQDCASIFKDFTQTSTGLNRSHEGAGLGLSISRQLAQLMNGDIKVASKEGHGSTFTLSIPVDAETVPVKPVELDQKMALALLSDDTPARAALAQSIEQLGFRVALCKDLKQFRTLNSARRFTHVVADFDLAKLEEFPDAKLIVLGDVADRDQTISTLTGQKAGWLTWPVRKQTLQKVLTPNAKPSEKTQTAEQSNRDKEPSLSPDHPTQKQKRLNILVAEDNPINAMLVKALLGKLGHNITHVENGELACEALGETNDNSFDLVLMDLHMPVLDGLGALARIRKQEAKLKTNPPMRIVVLSADGQQERQEMAIANGADDYLTKPLDFDEVERVVNWNTNNAHVITQATG